MDLRPRTLKNLFLEGMRQANAQDAPEESEAPEDPPPPPKAAGAPAFSANRGRANVPYQEWRNGQLFDITQPPPPPDPPDPPKDEEGEPDDGQGDDQEPEDEGEEEVKARRLARLTPTFRQAVTPGYRPAPYEVRPAPRQTITDWWYGLDAIRRWMLYNGAALAAGFALHLPQYVTSRTAYLVAVHHSWSDKHLVFCYLVVAAVWLLDHSTRRWPFLVALILRVPLISLVIGVLLYGRTDMPT